MLFACIFVPDFPAAAIVRAEPELRGAAVAVLEGRPPMLTVASANERARHVGVELGMTKLQAEARLAAFVITKPERFSVVRRRSVAQESAARAALGDCARGISPRVEEPDDMPDTVLLDISGLERLFGTPQSIAIELARRAAEVGLEANVAVCSNIEAAICAARGFPGVTVIEGNTAPARLAPLGLRVLLESAAIDTAVANDLLETFDRWGIRTCRAFAALPEIAVAERLGTQGVHLQKLARGEGTRTLAPTDRPVEFEEAIELEYPIEDLESLAFVLNRLIEQLCARLQARALSTNELRLRMQLERSQNDIRLSQPDHSITRSPDSSFAHPLQYARAIRLPVPMLDAKTFLRLWQLELRGNPPGAPVEKIWLRAEPVEPRFTQGGLFLPTAPEPERLEITLARIAAVVRAKNSNANDEIRVGTAEVLDTHAPDAFRMKRFVASSGASKSNMPTVNTASASQTIIRRLRPPTAISVDVRDGRPITIRNAPTPFPPESKVTWSAGPWCISGEWWKDNWSREEWDVAIIVQHGNLFCRIYRDAMSNTWLLEGTYD